MKLKLSVAFIFFAIGTATLVDWIIYAEKNKQLPLETFRAKYYQRFPGFLERLFAASSSWQALILIVLFSIAGLIFVRQKKRAYMILGIISFLFASWNLFSLM